MLGSEHRLVLTDIDEAALASLADELDVEGHEVAACRAADIGNAHAVWETLDLARSKGALRAIAHTAGLSPALADWKAILSVNLIGTENLLCTVEANVEGPLSIVVVASMAGHMVAESSAIDALFADPFASGLFEKAEPLFAALARDCDPYGLASPAYGHTKRANIRSVEQRAAAWARDGKRINSISPGMIRTPMGMAEVNDNPAAKAVLDATPVGRWGSVLDIAHLAAFLLSDRAAFITGADVRIDGGVTPALRYGRVSGKT
jgi:NAD(P)-dependent dehydrogenase (short-subunit alcohol dehydrogenase family)